MLKHLARIEDKENGHILISRNKFENPKLINLFTTNIRRHFMMRTRKRRLGLDSEETETDNCQALLSNRVKFV